jgi:PIN domain nuclease of toxin-antitoxin system
MRLQSLNKETISNMQKRKLGKSNPLEVSAIGLWELAFLTARGKR